MSGVLSRAQASNGVPADQGTGKLAFPIARSWGDLTAMLAARQAAAPIKLVVLDGDNVLFRPSGYLGSEAQEWDSGKLAGQATILRRRDVDEARMVTHEFFEVPTGMDVKTRADLHSLGRKAAIACVSARPASLRPVVNSILAMTAPIAVTEVVLANGRGSAKVASIAQLAARHGVTSENQVVVVDDLVANLGPAKQAGYHCVCFAPTSRNYEEVSARGFIELARRASNAQTRFELLLNAYARASARELEGIKRTITALLPSSQLPLWSRASEGLRDLVVPYAPGQPLAWP